MLTLPRSSLLWGGRLPQVIQAIRPDGKEQTPWLRSEVGHITVCAQECVEIGLAFMVDSLRWPWASRLHSASKPSHDIWVAKSFAEAGGTRSAEMHRSSRMRPGLKRKRASYSTGKLTAMLSQLLVAIKNQARACCHYGVAGLMQHGASLRFTIHQEIFEALWGPNFVPFRLAQVATSKAE